MKPQEVTRQDIIKLLSGVLEEGENLLVTKQVPVLDSEGNLQFHNDGALKATWPPMLLSGLGRSWKENGPWYVNIAIFNGPRATYTNAVSVNMLVCDDVGTKSKPIEGLTPTWVIETSPGNFQHAYLLSTPADPTVFAESINALARAGYTDPGATNAVRWVRLPGSINLKPAHNGFRAVMHTWNPDVHHELEAILAAAGVEVMDGDRVRTKGLTPIKIEEDGADPVLQWLSDQNLVLGGPGPEGWYQIHCPNAVEHTGGDPCAKYLPSSHGFRCFHGHCDHLGSREFLDWVAEQGGPKEEPGVRQDLMVAPMAKAMEKLQAVREHAIEAGEEPIFPEDQDAAPEEHVNAAAAERNSWGIRYAYVQEDDSYYDLITRDRLSRASFDAIYRALRCNSRHTGRLTSASKWFDEHRVEIGGQVISNFTYAAGDAALLTRDGQVYGNLWRDARPKPYYEQMPDITPWLKHLARMVPDPIVQRHLLNWMAYKVQHPEKKLNHQIFLGSVPGGGKDLLITPFLWAIGGDALGNVSVVDAKKFDSSFSYHVASELIVINEANEIKYRERRQLEEDLKPFCAAPPLTMDVNKKNRHPYPAMNRMSVIAMSNHRDGITLSSEDRRWTVIWSNVPRMDDEAGEALFDWLDLGGKEAVAHYLMCHAIDKDFMPQGNALWTEDKAILCQASLSDAEEWLVDEIQSGRGVFAAGIVAGPFTTVTDLVSARAPSGVKLNRRALEYALKTCKWVDHGMCSSRVGVTVLTAKHIYTRPGMHEGVSRSDLRKMVEPAAVASPVAKLKSVG